MLGKCLDCGAPYEETDMSCRECMAPVSDVFVPWEKPTEEDGPIFESVFKTALVVLVPIATVLVWMLLGWLDGWLDKLITLIF